jgi:hypothetical protein
MHIGAYSLNNCDKVTQHIVPFGAIKLAPTTAIGHIKDV